VNRPRPCIATVFGRQRLPAAGHVDHAQTGGIMEKLKLPVADLRVESFELGEALRAKGTVEARASGPGGGCCTRIDTGCNPDRTQVLTIPCCP
jgi:hypothetical protein